MAKKLEYDIVTDPSKGIAGLKQFSSAAKRALADVEGSFDDTTTSAQKVAKALSGLADEIEADMKGAAKAADALAAALGPELSSRANLDSIVADLNKMGLSFDEIATDADALAASLKKLDGVQLDSAQAGLAKMDDASRRTKGSVDDVGKSLDGAKNVSANAIGNIAGDLSNLGGVAGSAGVAIGQMGEYMADAAASGKEGFGAIVKNFATIAGPLTAATIAVGVLTETFTNFQQAAAETKAFRRDRVDAFVDALTDAKVTAEELQEVLSTGGEGEGIFIRVADETRNADKSVSHFFGNLKNFNKAITRGLPGYDAWADALVNTQAAAGASEESLRKLRIVLDDARDGQVSSVAATVAQSDGLRVVQEAALAYASAIEDGGVALDRAGFEARFYGEAVEDGTDALERQHDALEQSRSDLESQEQAFRDALLAGAEMQRAINQMAEPFPSMEGRADALTKAFDLKNAPLESLEQVADYEEGLRDFVKFVRGDLKGVIPNIFDPNDLHREEFLSKIAGMRQAVQERVVDAFTTDGAEGAKRMADGLVEQFRKSLGGKISAKDLQTLLGLEDIEATLKVAVDLDSMARAQRLLELFAQLPTTDPALVMQLQMDLDAKRITPEGVRQIIDDQIQGVHADIPTSMVAPDENSLNAARTDANNFYDRNKALMETTAKPPDDLAKMLIATQRELDRVKLQIAVEAVITGKKNLFDKFTFDAGGIVRRGGGIVAERRPEILNGRWLATSPTVVPPGTRVTSGARTARILKSRGLRGLRRYDSGGTVVAGPRTVNVNVNAAVVGNRFDVMRAVRRASLDAERMLGTRG